MEVWRKSFRGVISGKTIEVSNLDRIRIIKLQTKRIAYPKMQLDPKGYLIFSFNSKEIKTTFPFHRIKAEAFLPMPDELKKYSPKMLDVHHKNGIRTDNRLCNLEWKMRGKHISEHRMGKPTTLGRRHSEITKNKISKSHIGKVTYFKISLEMWKFLTIYFKDLIENGMPKEKAYQLISCLNDISEVQTKRRIRKILKK